MSEIKVSLFRWLGDDHPDIRLFRGAKEAGICICAGMRQLLSSMTREGIFMEIN